MNNKEGGPEGRQPPIPTAPRKRRSLFFNRDAQAALLIYQSSAGKSTPLGDEGLATHVNIKISI